MKKGKRILCIAGMALLIAEVLSGCGLETGETTSDIEMAEAVKETPQVPEEAQEAEVQGAEGEDQEEKVEAKVSETASEMQDMAKDIRWQDFLKDMGMGWNLGNTFDADDCTWLSNEMDYEGAWLPGNPKTTKEMILLAKEEGFRTIRIPVSWHNHVEISEDGQGGKVYTISRQWLERVREVVDDCYEEGLYVIINIHHDDRTENFIYPTEEHREQSLAYITQIWTQIAEEFAGYDTHLLFGVFNEVRLTGTADEWNAASRTSMQAQKLINEYGQAAVDAIRAVDKGYNKERFIMCPGYAGSLDSYPLYVLPSDPGGYQNRIIVEIHAYTPYNFCMNVSAGATSIFDQKVKYDVEQLFLTINKQWTSNDIPVVISEWGTILKEDNVEERIKHARYYVSMAMTSCKDSTGEAVSIPCILWDNQNVQNLSAGETFGYMDRNNLTWFDKEYVDAVIDAWRNPMKD